jgi:hypothetical protein
MWLWVFSVVIWRLCELLDWEWSIGFCVKPTSWRWSDTNLGRQILIIIFEKKSMGDESSFWLLVRPCRLCFLDRRIWPSPLISSVHFCVGNHVGFFIHDDFFGYLSLYLLMWSELGWSQHVWPMGDRLRMQWSRAFSHMPLAEDQKIKHLEQCSKVIGLHLQIFIID